MEENIPTPEQAATNQNATQPSPTVTMNNRAWNQDDMASYAKVYGRPPYPGHYWYDKLSGMWGIMGQPPSGYMHPGHDYGELPSNASNGNTKVFINNRELTQTEYIGLCSIVGNYVMPGHYWLDAQGNAGMQGNPFPLVNLFAAANQNRLGGARGGDNFWSTGNSAGNSDGGASYINTGDGVVGYDSSGWS